ncbi:HEPN domain-containing protein [Vibrio tubiashii]|uniref:HEPN domain-containing protein n=1 Tax=Vibrio tubiashii TaxID=29498 RepID=UPI0031F3338A
MSQKAYFKLTSEQFIPYRNLTEVAFKLVSFLCFAMDETVALKNLVGKSTEILDGNENEVPIKVFYHSIPFESREPKKGWHQMLFTYDVIRENAELVINNWLAAYETVDPALNLYFATKTGAQKYTDGKFLALAQGLETYHRRTSSETLMGQSEFESLVQQIIQGCPEEHSDWLKGRLMHGNEINLGKRIKAIIEPFKDKLGNNRERSKLLRNIVNTRNYLTHYSDSLENHALNGAELWKLCQKMEAIFQLHFLKVIGFNEAEIASVIENCHFLNQKLSR